MGTGYQNTPVPAVAARGRNKTNRAQLLLHLTGPSAGGEFEFSPEGVSL